MPNPEGALPGRSRLSEILCMGCRTWFAADNFDCPFCGKVRPAYNPHIRRVKLENNLYEQAEYARKNH